MSTQENIVDSQEDDLDAFAAELFGQKEAAPVETNTEVEKSEVDESDAEDETHDTVEDADATEETEEEEAAESPKPKKNRFQERIDELVRNQREAERKLEDALAKLAEKEAQTESKPKTTTVDKGPQPTDLNEDGTEKYPLGEFDPKYIDDRADYRFEVRMKETEQARLKEEQTRMYEETQALLQENWDSKLAPAQERYPDFEDKMLDLKPVFDKIEPTFGEYLQNVIMAMDHGPDVLYYLSNHTDEAASLIQMGPSKATLALGRIEAKYAFEQEEKSKARPKVSDAPPPPPTNKGSAVAKPTIRGDEEDVNLDDFAKVLFKKK